MIADHARKDAPPGSFSWTYIEKSVAKGELQDLENHRAGPVAGTSRPVGSDRPTRGTRTTFSAADDRALAAWVTKAEVQGLSTKGNSIYQQLEKIVSKFAIWRTCADCFVIEPKAYLPILARSMGEIFTTSTTTRVTCQRYHSWSCLRAT
jgi:hypothetical protein